MLTKADQLKRNGRIKENLDYYEFPNGETVGISKDDQVKRYGRLKEKPLKDKAYLKWLHEVKRPHCFVCGNTN